MGSWTRRLTLRVLTSRGGIWAVALSVLWMITKTSIALGIFVGVAMGGAFFATAALALMAVLFLFLPRWKKNQLDRALKGLENWLPEESPEAFTHWQSWPIGPAVRAAVEESRGVRAKDLVLGRIDQEGRLSSTFGDFPGFEAIAEGSFLPPTSWDLDLVLTGDRVVVRKTFRDPGQELAHEAFALSRLAGATSVPAIHDWSLSEGTLHLNFPGGDSVSDLLVRTGAKILPEQTNDDPELQGLRPHKRLEAVLARGTERIPKCLSENFLSSLEAQVSAIHGRGVAGLDLTFSNLKVDRQKDQPSFLSLPGVRAYLPSSLNFAFTLRRWDDRAKLARWYGREDTW